MTIATPLTATTTAQPSSGVSKAFTSLIGLTALTVLLQSLFAGIFLRYDGQRNQSMGWINAHANGAHAATVLAIAAAALAVVKLRARRPLVVGSVLLAVLMLVESYIGGLIRDQGNNTLTAVHVPLAMAIMGVTVWLSLKAVELRRGVLESVPAQR